MKRIAISAICLSLLTVPGCKATAWFLYLFAPEKRTESVKPEYKELTDSTVAVVIFADYGVQYEYPTVQLELGLVTASQLKNNVKGLRVVDAVKVSKYQSENIHWDSMPRHELAKALDADYLLLVTLIEYSTHEPESLNLYRGRITAEASLYKASLADDQAEVWRDGDLHVVFPPESPSGVLAEDDRQIRYQTQLIFADLLAKKFYKHRREIE